MLHGREESGEPIRTVQMHDLVVADRDGLAIIAIERIVVGNDRIQVVVAAGKLDDDQHGILLCRSHGNLPPLEFVWRITRTDTRALLRYVSPARPKFPYIGGITSGSVDLQDALGIFACLRRVIWLLCCCACEAVKPPCSGLWSSSNQRLSIRIAWAHSLCRRGG